jgi:hypothetical protein
VAASVSTSASSRYQNATCHPRGVGTERDPKVVLVEVMPADWNNRERARRRLEPAGAFDMAGGAAELAALGRLTFCPCRVEYPERPFIGDVVRPTSSASEAWPSSVAQPARSTNVFTWTLSPRTCCGSPRSSPDRHHGLWRASRASVPMLRSCRSHRSARQEKGDRRHPRQSPTSATKLACSRRREFVWN